MEQEKTALEWFDMLIEPYCSQAKENTNVLMLGQTYDSFSNALHHSFTWEETPQGFFYWNMIEYSVDRGEAKYIKLTDTSNYEKQLEEKFVSEITQPPKFEDLINELITYIEEVERRVESERGDNSLEQVIEDEETLEVYYKLVQMRELPPNPTK